MRYISRNSKRVKAEIGFGVSPEINTVLIPDAFAEHMRGSVCIGLTFKDDFSKIEIAYRRLMQYCMENYWTPAGSILEWYRGDQIDAADIIIPVTQIGGEKQ
ncbi:hypothetical protein [Oceanobacillus sp. J11TS1]|uniref:hypothetical protein n=1 Tax=Oceanobacillus sp. J11TS1 TaxID=2807191 RepID=UPI001B118AFC|nr:hypothetical protein [Oceanobacillus sp. J11TS1]GIO25205.1 hypothetical protein J11TS1_37860 [Oceanobacillus sp. J11TS1]